jgi:hypothetical protein
MKAALVAERDDLGMALRVALGLERLVKAEALLAMQDTGPVEPRLWSHQPETRRAEHQRHGRQRDETALVHERRLVRAAEPGPHGERIEDGITPIVAIARFGNPEGVQALDVERPVLMHHLLV